MHFLTDRSRAFLLESTPLEEVASLGKSYDLVKVLKGLIQITVKEILKVLESLSSLLSAIHIH